MVKPSVLYISYDGMLEPLGQSQVIAYLERLADQYRFHLISFEKSADWADTVRRAAIKARLEAADIRWYPLTYHKSPSVPATLFDLALGTARAIMVAVRHKVKLVHARSYLPALMAQQVKRLVGTRFLFDMRGLWADERTDGGLWPENGRVYRTVKRLEQKLLLGADHVITLTHNSAREIKRFQYLKDHDLKLDVISTCADLDRFRPQPTLAPQVFTLGYLGSVGTWYLFDEVLEAYRLVAARRPDARLLIVNRNDQAYIRERVAAFRIDPARVELVAADHRDVPAMIARMTVGTAIIKPSYSKISSAPTKLAEYLGCGVPCLANYGVGDVGEMLEGERVGVALSGFSPFDRAAAIDRLFALLADTGLPARCRDVAERLLSLEKGVAQYRDIYHGMLNLPNDNRDA